MRTLDFPTQADIKRIYATTPLQPVRDTNRHIFTVLNKEVESTIFGTGLFNSIEAKELLLQLHYRLMDVAKSYVLMIYFFEKGIPDDEYYSSPGRRGETAEFYPHFDPIHSEVKDWFDYFSNAIYSNLFSAFDIAAHLINLQYELGMNQTRIQFGSVVKNEKLKVKNEHLYEELQKIKGDKIFSEANTLRNDITHNYLPNSAGLSITREKGDGWEGIKLGIRAYTSSSAIISNVQKTVDLLERVVTLVTE